LNFLLVRRQSTRQSFAQINLFHLNLKTMGHSRPRPKHLAKKVLQIRRSLGISQGEMVRQLGVQALIDHTTISKYELDKNEPPLAILLAYARLAGIPVEQIIDDELDLIF
jgi:DNA-binding XRE family transcriptional regulator